MIDYTELKRLAEAAESFKPTNLDLINPNYMAKAKAAHIAFADKAPPHVVLSMIDALDVQAGSIEAVQAANQRLAAERDKLRTQNQALRDDKEVLLNHMDTFMRVSNGPAIYNLAKVVIERFAQAEGGV